MKKSIYNWILFDEKYSYWYNSLTSSSLRLSKQLGARINKLLSSPEEIKINVPSFYQVLLDGGFLVEDGVDESVIVRNKYMDEINRKDYFLIILPTLNCNLKCPYCVQNHIPSRLTKEVTEKIKSHIRFIIKEEKIKSLNIEWFGGEPFLYFEEDILPLGKYAKELCNENDVLFTSSSTTNGTLITESIANKLSSLNFKRFQITLDGDRNLHNTIKFNNKIPSAFDLTLHNIKYILKNNPDIFINLRINYTTETLRSNIVDEVCEILPISLRERVLITLKKVWQEKVDLSRFDLYQDLLDKFYKQGFPVKRLDVVTNFMSCYANKRYYAAINYNGNCLKCTNCDLLYSNDSTGEISSSGKIIWKEGFEESNLAASFDNEHCLNCKLLPLCMGNCPKDHINSNKWICKMQSSDIDLKKAIIKAINEIYS